jgi:hypothetical protein
LILTRRNFLKAIAPAAIALPVLAEELLHPGRVFFLPPRSNPLLTGTIGRYDGFKVMDWPDIARLDQQASELARRRFTIVEPRWADVLRGRYVPLDQLVSRG